MIVGLVLAAGASTRLGEPKQLVHFMGQTLINRTANHLLTCCDQVCVVTGHQHDLIREHLAQAHAIHNPNWALGMGSSLKTGLQNLPPTCDAVLVAVCDQYLIPASHFQALILQHRAHKHPLWRPKRLNIWVFQRCLTLRFFR